MVDHLSEEALAAYGEPEVEEPATEIQGEAPAADEAADPALEAEAPAPEQSTPAPAADPYEQWGGQARVQDAMAIADALATREGVEALVREGLIAMDMDPDAAFGLAKGEEPPDPDELITRAQFEAERAKDRQTFAQQVQAQQETVAKAAVEGALSELGIVDDDDARRMVLTYAQNHVSGPQEMDPATLAKAVTAGYADYEAAMERAAKRYVEERQKKNDTVPKAVKGGGAPANEATPEEPPKNMEEARAAVRRAFPGAFNRD